MPCHEFGNSLKISEVVCRIVIIFVKDVVGLMGCGLNYICLMMIFSLLLDVAWDVFCNIYGSLNKFHCEVY